MQVDKIIQTLTNDFQFLLLTANKLAEIGKPISLKIGEKVFKDEDSAESIGILLKGAVRGYYSISNSKDFTLFVLTEGAVIADFEKLFMPTKNPLLFESLEESQILILNYAELQALQVQHHEVCIDANRFITSQLLESLYRIKSLVMNDGKKRVQELLNSDKKFFQRFNRKDLAYFVALKPESFSRILAGFKAKFKI